jgi:hypothetical protein
MTLVVSMRVMDGVILAADSLATIESQLVLQASTEVDCPHCAKHVQLDDLYAHAKAIVPCPACSKDVEISAIPSPEVRTASSTMSYAQKLFPFLDRYGVAVFGLSAFGQKTVYNHIKGLERTVRDKIELAPELLKLEYGGVTAVAEAIRAFAQAEFDKAYGSPPPANMPDQIFGLQVVGYDSPIDPTAKTIELQFGKVPRQEVYNNLSVTFSGDTRFILDLTALCAKHGKAAMQEHLSLQDAIDYADFLVGTAANVQRFANAIPTIGGEVDIALITAYSEFRWIRSKKLARVLEPRYVSHIT